MPLTVAGVQQEVVFRVGGKMTLANLPVTPDPVTGRVPGLLGPVRDALAYAGVTPADPATVTDADLARVPPKRSKTVFDAATLEALYYVQGNLTNAFDQQVEQERQSLHQIAADVEAMIARYQLMVPRLTLGGSAVGLPPAARIPNDPFRPPVAWTNPARPFPYPG